MTRDEGVAIIQEQLSFRTTLSSNIITNLQLAQTMLEAEPTKPWFLISDTNTLTTTADDQELALPSDFLEEIDDEVLIYVPADVGEEDPEVLLDKDELDVLKRTYKDADTGITSVGPPEAYALQGDNLIIFPTPDDEYDLQWKYYAKDTVLSTNVENGWLKHVPYLLLGVAGQQIAKGPIRDMVAWEVFKEWEAKGRAILTAKNISRDMSNRDLQVGGPH